MSPQYRRLIASDRVRRAETHRIRGALGYLAFMAGSRDDYDWLFSDGSSRSGVPSKRPTGAGSTADSGSETGVVADDGPPHELPPPNLPPPTKSPRGSATTRSRGRSTGRFIRRFVGMLLLAALLFYGGVSAVAWSKLTRVNAASLGDSLADQPGTTFLMVGTDKRNPNEERGRTDTILLLHFGAGPTVLTSIPRDSIVPIPGHGTTKINAAYAHGGPALLVEVVEQNTGIKVDGYVEIGFEGLVDVVDAIDGVEVCPETDLQDRDSHLDISAGCQNVDGTTALAYSRNRKSFDTGDIQRGQNQREVIGAIGSKIRSPRTLEPRRYANLALSSSDAIVLGDEVSVVDFGRFAWTLSGAMAGNGLNCTVPIADFQVNWDADRASEFFAMLATGRADRLGDLCTPDGRPANR